jgi:hypothetical protein
MSNGLDAREYSLLHKALKGREEEMELFRFSINQTA